MFLQPCASRAGLAVVVSVLLAVPCVTTAQETATKTAPAADSGTGRLRVHVVGSDGKTAVEGAIVRAYHLESGKVFESGKTSAAGDCAVTGLPYGYFDLSVESQGGYFVGNQVLNIPPAGSHSVTLGISSYAEKPPAWWNGKTARDVPGTNTAARGVAEIRVKAKGRDFWKSPAGIAVIVGGSAAVLLAIAGGGGSSGSASPSTP